MQFYKLLLQSYQATQVEKIPKWNRNQNKLEIKEMVPKCKAHTHDKVFAS